MELKLAGLHELNEKEMVLTDGEFWNTIKSAFDNTVDFVSNNASKVVATVGGVATVVAGVAAIAAPEPLSTVGGVAGVVAGVSWIASTWMD